MFTVVIKLRDGKEYTFKNVKLSKALSMIRQASVFGDVLSASMEDKQQVLGVK